jgi:extracellular elastinolytic metalloproteinase
VAPLGAGSAVLLRQRFDGLAAGHDGLIALGIAGGKIAYTSSSLSPAQSVQGTVLVTSDAAIASAARNAGIDRASATVADARLVALPTPTDGIRPAWETTLIDGEGADAVQSYVDAETGEVLLRESLVDYLTDNPTWSVFPNVPPLDYSSADTRELWCWLTGAPGCDRVVGNSAATVEWDVFPGTGPTFTTKGNAARSTEKWNSNVSNSQGTNYATPSPTRDYSYGWTNQWYEQRCNPATFMSPQRNDIDAATANLFAMHNRMHDWSYYLGFTEPNSNMQERNFGRGGAENDPEHGNSQAGGVVGGPPGFQSRDNSG